MTYNKDNIQNIIFNIDNSNADYIIDIGDNYTVEHLRLKKFEKVSNKQWTVLDILTKLNCKEWIPKGMYIED